MRVRKCAARSRTSSRKSTRAVGRVIEDQPRAVEELLDPASASSAGRARGSSAARRGAPPARAAGASAAATTSSRVARRTTTVRRIGRRLRGARRAAASGARQRCRRAGPSVVSTTSCSPGSRHGSPRSSRSSGSRNDTRPADRRELDADERAVSGLRLTGSTHAGLRAHTAATPASRRRSSGWRCDRAPTARDRRPRTREARDRRRTTCSSALRAAA